MNETNKQEIVTKVASLIKDSYVFPDLGAKLAQTLLSNYSQHNYAHTNTPKDLAKALNKDLEPIANDKHLGVKSDPQLITNLKSEASGGDDTAHHDFVRSLNYGFGESKILDSNIGYLKLDIFADTDTYPEAVALAEQTMSLFKNAQAIIFDLRENGGGHPNMIQLLTSYFFEGEPLHLNSFYWREADSETQFWTLPDVEGKKLPDTELFILTSNKTFSAAEEFCYNLKNLKRATLIGEVTGGGAHPGGFHLIDDDLAVFIPSGRAINPITKTNWEGVGVAPDIKVSADEALDVALEMALASKDHFAAT